MTEALRQYVNGTFGQLHVRVAAPKQPSSPPLVCVHMFPLSSRSFEPLLAALDDRRTVVALDLPGYGESAAPANQITAETYAKSIWEAVDALNLLEEWPSIDLFGIHAGAKLAVEAAYQRSNQTRRLALSSAAVLTEEEVRQYRQSLGLTPLDCEGTRFQKLWDGQVNYYGNNLSLERIASSYAEVLRGGEKYHWGHAAVFDYNERFPERIAKLENPILLINPGDDLYSMTPRTFPLISNGKLLDRHHWKAGFLETNAEELAKDISRFLAGP